MRHKCISVTVIQVCPIHLADNVLVARTLCSLTNSPVAETLD